MNVPGKRALTIALIVSSGLTALTASRATVQTERPTSVASASYAPTYFSDTNHPVSRSYVEVRASRSAYRVYVPPTVPVTLAPASKSKVDIVISFALAQRGKPYLWGASGPLAYDCSGLVMRSFAQVHIYLPHFTGSMLHYGRYVSRAQLQPGDIVFPSSHHVAIYIGHGKMIVAPHSGTVVQIQNVYAFYTARRLL